MTDTPHHPTTAYKQPPKESAPVDHGPVQRWQHGGWLLEFTETAGVLAARVVEEHIVDIMVMKGLLSRSQSVAAFKLKLDYQRVGLGIHLTSTYSPARTETDFFNGARDRTDSEEAAYQRWRNAVREMGQRFSAPVIATVCHDRVPTPRDAALMRLGLEKLVVWYRLPQEEKAGARQD